MLLTIFQYVRWISNQFYLIKHLIEQSILKQRIQTKNTDRDNAQEILITINQLVRVRVYTISLM